MKINWDLEHVYFYLVCFIALILIIIGAVTITQTAIAYVTPINDEYSHSPYTMRDPNPDLLQWEERFGTEFVEREQERFESINQENTGRRLLRDLVSGFAFMIVALPVYLYHWRKIPWLEANG